MSVLLAGLFVSVSGAALGWLVRRRTLQLEASTKAARKVNKPTEPERPPAFAGFPCQLGDVVLRMTGEEAWLSSALLFREKEPVSALFVAPDKGTNLALYVLPSPRASIDWLEPLDPVLIGLVGREPPNAVEIDRVRYDRVRLLPLEVTKMGTGAPDIEGTVLVAEYVSAGSARLVVVKGPSGSFVYRGVFLDPSTYEVIASGASTLR